MARFVFLFLLFPSLALANLIFPKQMNSKDRQLALEVLAYGSAPRVLSNPYPLGGYSGVELGVSWEFLPTQSLSKRGAGAPAQDQTSYFQLTAAKGLYYNFDFFLSFAPMGQQEEISSYGGGVRWGFFEGQIWPVMVSLQVAANSTNFQNRIDVTNQTMDLMGTYLARDLSFYAGLGRIRSSGTFMGGSTGVTSSGEVENETLSDNRFFIGSAYQWNSVIFAVEAQKVTETSFGLKLGTRF